MPKVSREKEITKIRTEINKIDTKTITERSKKLRTVFFLKIKQDLIGFIFYAYSLGIGGF